MRTTTPTETRYPAELPVVAYERKALRLHDRIVGRVARHLWLAVTGKHEAFAFEEPRPERSTTLHPDEPRADGLRALGLERFLTPGAV